MWRGLWAMTLASAAAACIPPPRCGAAVNIEAWRKEVRPPPAVASEMTWSRDGCAHGDRRVATTIHVLPPAPEVRASGANVFFMPATSYAVWLMTHATANATKGLPIAVDALVLQSFSKQATADADGNVDLGSNFPGRYVAFTVYDVVDGDPPNRDVFVYERVVDLSDASSAHIELAPTRHLSNPPSTPAPPTFKGTLVDIRRVHDRP